MQPIEHVIRIRRCFAVEVRSRRQVADGVVGECLCHTDGELTQGFTVSSMRLRSSSPEAGMFNTALSTAGYQDNFSGKNSAKRSS